MIELRATLMRKDKNLFDVQFGLDEHTLNSQKKGQSAGEISTLLGKKNILSIGEPEVLNLVKLLAAKGADIPGEVKLMLDKYDFYQVRLACTFKPDKDCKFVWSRFGLRLIAKNGQQRAKMKSPVAHDIFPKEVSKEIKIKRNFGIGPKFTYNFFEIGVTSESEQEYIRYEPEIISSGLLQSNPCWDFKSSKARDFIAGDKELFIILKAPKSMSVEANFVLGAEVHTFLGILPMIPVRIYRADSLVEGKLLLIK